MLARLEVPPGTWLMYEHMVLADPDRSGNWRFRIGQDGCFFSARNSRLWLGEPDQFTSDDPDLFWTGPFPDEPARCLTPAQRDELRSAIRAAGLGSLESRYGPDEDETVSPPYAERWTVVEQGSPRTIVVESGAVPEGLRRLREEIDRLVAAAPAGGRPVPGG